MKLKKILSLLLSLSLVFSFAACSQEEPETPKKDLTGMKDEEVIEELLSGYEGLQFSAATYEANLRCSYGGNEISVSSKVSVKGEDFSLASATTLGETSQTVDMVFVDGVFYLNLMGIKTKEVLGKGQADLALEQQLPFVLEDLEVFEQRDLLRGEEGSYVVVLSQPTDELLSLLDLKNLLSVEGEKAGEDAEEKDGEEDGNEDGDGADALPSSDPEFRLKETFLSLAFDRNGDLQKITLGVEASVLENGVESALKLDVTYRVLTTDSAKIEIKAPAGLSEYEDISGETVDTDDAGDGSSGSGTNGGSETTDA